METSEILIKRDNLKNKLGIAGIAASVIIAGVFYAFLVQAVVGVLALGVAFTLGLAIVYLTPWVSLKLSNLAYRLEDLEKINHLKSVEAIASANPIETLTNLLQAKRVAFKEFEENVVNATTARDTFKSKLEKFSKTYPHRAAEFQTQYDRMALLVKKKQVALKDAQKSLEEGNLKLEEMKAYWEMSKEAIALNKVAGMDTGDAFEKLKADTACDSVFESMNRAFAQLEVAAALDVSANAEIEYNNDTSLLVLDLSTKKEISK